MNEVNFLGNIQKTIWELNEENIDESIETIKTLYDSNFPISFNQVLMHFIYSSIESQKNDLNIYFEFIKRLQTPNDQFIDIFSHFLLHIYTQESNYLLEKLIENDFIKPNIIRNRKSLYFAHYKSINEINKLIENLSTPFNTEFHEGIKELSNNDWELHKIHVNEGHNPNELAIIIRNDEVEKLQKLSSQTNFDFDQKIEPSLYERCDFINKENVSLIDYAAFFSAVKCFKYLLMNGADIIHTFKYAIAGGNIEIIHLCEQNHSFYERSMKAAIKFHQNDIFHYIHENNFEVNNLEDLIMESIVSDNYEILSFLEGKGRKVNNSLINYLTENGNIFLLKHFLEGNDLPKDILITAVKSRNIEIVKYILDQRGIYMNVIDIFLV